MLRLVISKLVNKTLGKFGFEVRTISPLQSLQHYLQSLQKRGIEIQIVYDIGANNGAWSTNIKKILGPKTKFFYLKLIVFITEV